MTLWISWSSLRSHEECRQKGMLQRARKKATLADQRIYFPGTVLDRVVRDWLNDDPEHNPGVMPDMVNEIMVREFNNVVEEGGRVAFRDKADKVQVRDDVVEAVQKIEPLLRQHVLPYEYQVDFRFRAPLMVPSPWGQEMVIINGAMDILTRNDKGEFGVLDVKMTRNNDYWRKTYGQLSFYDTAVGILFEGAKTFDSGLLQPLCEQGYLPLPVSMQLRSQMAQRVVRMAHDIWREDFTPTKNLGSCSGCDVKHACSRFQPVLNKSGKKTISIGS